MSYPTIPYVPTTSTTVYNPYATCTPTYNSAGDINCGSMTYCIPCGGGATTTTTVPALPAPVQYTLCPYNPYHSGGSNGCVTSACGAASCTGILPTPVECCSVSYCCNANNIDCVNGCYTTKVTLDWIAPMIYFAGLSTEIQSDDLSLVLQFQSQNTDSCVVDNTCASSCCSDTNTLHMPCCCSSSPCGCCCYPTFSQSSEIPSLTFTGPSSSGVCGALEGESSDSISLVTPLNSCCPNPGSDTIQIQILATIGKSLSGSAIGTLTSSESSTGLSIPIVSLLDSNTEATLTLYFTYTCVCNQPTWTIYNAKLLLE